MAWTFCAASSCTPKTLPSTWVLSFRVTVVLLSDLLSLPPPKTLPLPSRPVVPILLLPPMVREMVPVTLPRSVMMTFLEQ